jgi:hypothetical protein
MTQQTDAELIAELRKLQDKNESTYIWIPEEYASRLLALAEDGVKWRQRVKRPPPPFEKVGDEHD